MSLKSSDLRRTQDKPDAPAERSNAKIRQLQEMFPTWSDDDLRSLLQEVNYDIELAATRISEGHAEQWGAVTRKKDKRSAHGSSAQASSDRGGSRGARGGRGGARGGRGGARGAGRGGHRETNGRHAPSPAPHASTSGAQATSHPSAAVSDAPRSTDRPKTNGTPDPAATTGWGDAGESSVHVEAASASKMAETSQDAWVNGATTTRVESASQTQTPALAPTARPVVKTPATSKMSWAQIAKPHEKPKPAPSPAPSAVQPTPAEVPPSVPPVSHAPEPVTAPSPDVEEKPQPEATGWEEPTTAQTPTWEEPTTAQAPTWDDEPSSQPTVKATADGWITSVTVQREAQPEPAPVQAPQPSPPKQPEPEVIPTPSAFPAQLGLQQKTDSTVVSPAKPSTPVSYARSINSRAGHRFKATDQAVIMPSTFGSSVEKLGMQFGSVNLVGEDVDANATEPSAPEASAPAPAPAAAAAEPVREPQPQTTHAPPPEPAPVSKEQIPVTKNLFQQAAVPQQAQQTQVQQQPQPTSQILSSLQSAQPPSLLSAQSSAPPVTQTNTSTASSSPLTSFSAQQQTPSSQSSISPYQQHSVQQQPVQQQPQAPQPPPSSQSLLQQQQQSQLHQQFSHFQSHLDHPTSSQSPSQSQQSQQQSSLHQSLGSHGSYYRQPEQSFQHAATPPAAQGQEPPYGSFAPLSQQLGYQAQSSHSGGFGSDHFGYNDGQRGFYDSYGQQSPFGGRNALGHDDLGKSLSGSQPATQAGTGVPQSVPQSAQQQTSQQPQSAAQPQGPAGQPQQGYAPVPYYYPYQPGQFYGAPYGSGYGLGQYANRYPQQQPPMFQPTNPTSAASPANAKGPNAVQPQSNPYAAPGLYGQQHASSAYDDGYGHHSQLGPQHTPGVGGLPTNDYGKPLYGSQGIQSFMGQSSTPVQLGQRGAGTNGSPENSYKPYGPGVGVGAKDVGGAPGVGSGIAGAQGGLGQGGRGGVQQPNQFYGANRFSSNPGASGPPSQQGGQQANQGYPQAAADNFYYGRPSQNGPPYWG